MAGHEQLERRIGEMKQARGDWQALGEAAKLRVLESEFDWTGIGDRAKEAVLAARDRFQQDQPRATQRHL